MAAEGQKKWNTKNLGLRLGADAVSAASAGALVAPVVTIIDRSIMENASKRASSVGSSIWQSLTSLLRRPHEFLLSRPFRLVFLLYGGTYLTANALDTVASAVAHLPAAHVSSGTAKFAATSLANVSLCVYKDRAFVRLFGTITATATPRAVPAASYLLFTLRDCLTVFASFNVPPVLGPWLTDRLGAAAGSGRPALPVHVGGDTLAQLAAPAGVQLFSTPLHLLGLDLYNRPYVLQTRRPSWRDRWAAVYRNWAVSTAARMCRILPAFGVGGVVNTRARRKLMEGLD